MPVPDLVREPAPETVPVRVLLALSVPVVRMPARVTVPPLDKLLMVSLPPRASVAPEATVTPEVLASRLALVVESVPALTVVAPV